jgi:hypothetical protein
MDPRERAAKLKAIIDDLDKFRAELRDRVRKERPDLTEAQLDAMWRQLAEQFGL